MPVTSCEHGNPKGRCKECGTGYCEHGRQKQRCEECRNVKAPKQSSKRQKISQQTAADEIEYPETPGAGWMLPPPLQSN